MRDDLVDRRGDRDDRRIMMAAWLTVALIASACGTDADDSSRVTLNAPDASPDADADPGADGMDPDSGYHTSVGTDSEADDDGERHTATPGADRPTKDGDGTASSGDSGHTADSDETGFAADSGLGYWESVIDSASERDGRVPLSRVDCPGNPSILGSDVSGIVCALATVPVDRADPSLGVVDVSLIVWPADGSTTHDGAPLAVLQGGPGGASTDMVAYYPRRPYAQVFIDQRGTGFGSSDFDCPELDDVLVETLEADIDDAERIQLDAYRRCYARISDDPVMEHTDTAAHAADVADVMAALGADRWFVYGVSYGTTIALEVLRASPEGLAGAVLDGVYPPDLDLHADLAFSARRALDEFHEACAESASCSAMVQEGDLRAMVEGLIRRLDDDPIRVTLNAADTRLGESVDVFVDGESLAGLLFQLMYNDQTAVTVVSLMAALAADVAEMDRYLAIFAVEYALLIHESNDEGVYFSANCADRMPFASEPPEGMGIFEAAVLGEGIADVCGVWDVPASPSTAASPVISDLPVLLLSGRFDPIAPPDLADRAARNLSDSVHVVRDGRSHGVWLGDDCIEGIVADFLADPQSELDTACADEPMPLSWLSFYG